MNFFMHRRVFCAKYATAKAEILPVLCWKLTAPDPPYHPREKAKGTFRSDPLHSLVDTCLSAGVSRACCVLQPAAEQNLILRQLQKPRPWCPVLSLPANNCAATGGSSTRSHIPAQPGWRQSTTTVPRQAGAAQLTPLEWRQRLCIFLSALRMKPPSELLHFGEGASAVAPPSSPVGLQARAAHRRETLCGTHRAPRICSNRRKTAFLGHVLLVRDASVRKSH